ncbi:MAG: hypothetical protein EXQ47_00885 [Bryobacterales bacterium]|nr:hypothetical protein [Bryobacterales bacterium]
MAASVPGLVCSGLVLLGYCAKQKFTWEGRELASVSECIAKRPPSWVDRWDCNRATCWNSEAEAWACVPEQRKAEFAVFAYRLLPMLFDLSGDGRAIAVDELFPRELPALPAGPAPPGYAALGYDVVERNIVLGTLAFGCSPLSCNGMAREIPVNQFCLLAEMEDALAAARRFGMEQPEPGPYVIIEVLTPPVRI